MPFNIIPDLHGKGEGRMVLLVLDGLGGLPHPRTGLTELETARTPHMDRLAREGVCGLHQPVDYGITPGSGPGHLALFGYDPKEHQVGRGALAAAGIDFDLREGDVAARGNFCTLDDDGNIADRRAGRIPTEKNEELCDLLRSIELPKVEVFVQPVKEHRFLLVLRGANLDECVDDTDPQQAGVPPKQAHACDSEAEQTAKLVNSWVKQAHQVLARHRPANGVLLRGFANPPKWPLMTEVFGITPAAVAAYPMYRGLAQWLGMTKLPTEDRVLGTFEVVEQNWGGFDFFYVHIKKVDSLGEDGDFDAKVEKIEEVDRHLPLLLDLHPTALAITGDHSTPATMASHSWHPVPVLLQGLNCRPDRVEAFGERDCMSGGLGPRLPTTALMPLLLAHNSQLQKFGA
jgi:2,3-bisphosphoglycerate-independent phosphoglycerate mutase